MLLHKSVQITKNDRLRVFLPLRVSTPTVKQYALAPSRRHWLRKQANRSAEQDYQSILEPVGQ
jgi:hypothetical protein